MQSDTPSIRSLLTFGFRAQAFGGLGTLRDNQDCDDGVVGTGLCTCQAGREASIRGSKEALRA